MDSAKCTPSSISSRPPVINDGGISGSLGPWFILAVLLTVANTPESHRTQNCRHIETVHRGNDFVGTRCKRRTRSKHGQAAIFSQDIGVPALWTAPPAHNLTPARRAPNLYACNQKYTRQISSGTDLRFLHIPRNMAHNLIPDIMAYQVARPGRKKVPFCWDFSGRPVFAARISIIDEDGRVWPILLRTYVTSKQYHRRLSAGWGLFAAHHALRPGDAVHFWRRKEDECAGALVMRAEVVHAFSR